MRTVGKVLGVFLLLLIGVGAGFWATGAFPGIPGLLARSHTDEQEIVDAVTRTKEVSLLSLGIQGITQKTEHSQVFGVDVPGSDRAQFIQYSFNAKLGIDGQDVRLEKEGEDNFLVSVPAFTFIGYDDVRLELAAEDNGVLSWVTPDIDTVGMVNGILDEKNRRQYIETNEDVLKDQAKAFYQTLITSVDPDAIVEFEFH